MPGDNDPNEIVRSNASLPARPTTLRLGATEEIDLTPLSPASAEEIRKLHASKAVERDHNRETLRQDLSATDKKLEIFTKNVSDTVSDNAAVTITNVHEDSLGRTEIMIGNTDAARRGKLTRSQSGFGDNATFWFIIVGILGAVIVLVAALKH